MDIGYQLLDFIPFLNSFAGLLMLPFFTRTLIVANANSWQLR
jgi:hypothetical protein